MSPPERLRITGGVARGRLLAEPVGSGVRPTSARVREALFSLVGQDLGGQRVLDAYGGSGLLGFEAWSRGAAVVVVESDGEAARRIRSNAAQLRAEVEVHHGSVLALGPALGRFHGVIADPPYSLDPAPILAALTRVADDWLVLETDERVPEPVAPVGWTLDRRRTYGGTALVVYRAADSAGPGG